ncbi:hypothetical protein, partial [Luteibacter sp.]|uniref:hypothetical protein n=1 Tax=Luteibacter sp. TaxID=1886636 RepID=UPI003F7E06CA
MKLLATMAMAVALGACADKPVAPFASAPFSVARKGNAISIPFTVGPFAEFGYRYMLALKYERPERDDPVALLSGTSTEGTLRLRVKLVRIERGQEHVVAINDHATVTYDAAKATYCHGESMATRGSDVAN